METKKFEISNNLFNPFKSIEDLKEHHEEVKKRSKDNNLFQYGSEVNIYCLPIIIEEKEKQAVFEVCSNILNLIMNIQKEFFQNNHLEYFDLLGYSILEQEIFNSNLSYGNCWFARADLMRSNQIFKLIEFNVDSAVGGTETGDLCKLISDQLGSKLKNYSYVDPSQGIISSFNQLFIEKGWDKKEKTVGIIDWYPDMTEYIEDHKNIVNLFEQHGFNAVICHQDNVNVRNEELFLGDKKIDVLYKFFLLSDAEKNLAWIKDILIPIKKKKLIMVNDIQTDVFSNKGNLAILWDSKYNSKLSKENQKLIKQYIPWTSFFDKKTNCIYEGKNMSVIEIANKYKDSMVLKPIRGYGGKGVKLGWKCSPEVWEDYIDKILKNKEKYIIQERVISDVEMLPYIKGKHVQYLDTELNFGLLLSRNKFNGMFLRGIPKKSEVINNISQGASIGTVFIKE